MSKAFKPLNKKRGKSPPRESLAKLSTSLLTIFALTR